MSIRKKAFHQNNKMTTTRHKNLRQKLNAMGYRQPLSFESVALVERLLKDIIRFSERPPPLLKDGKDPEKLLEFLKSENAHLLQENNRLHQALMSRLEPSDSSSYEVRNKLRKLENENNDLKFLNNQYLSKIQEMEKDISEKTKKLLILHEKVNPVIQLRPQDKGTKRKTSAFVHQKMELESPLPESRVQYLGSSPSMTSADDEPYVADLLALADKRNNQLREELEDANSCIEQLKNTIQTLEYKLGNRDQEIERLNRQLLMGYGESHGHVQVDSGYLQLWNKVEDIEKSREELQKDLRSACEIRRELESKCMQLSMHNKELQDELHKLIKLNERIQEDSDRMLHASFKEHDHSYELNHLKAELDRKDLILQDQEIEIQSLQNEKGMLRDKINQLLTSENKLLDEICQLKQASSLPPSKKNLKRSQLPKPTPNKSNEIKLLEMQRDFYKRRAEDLTRFMSVHKDGCCLHSVQGHRSDVELRKPRFRSPLSTSHQCAAASSKFALGRRAVTPPPRLNPAHRQKSYKSRSLSPKGRSVTICHKQLSKSKPEFSKICPSLAEHQIQQLKEERDYYERQYEKLRSEKLKRELSPPVKEKDSYCKYETQKLYDEKIELQKKCLRLEERIDQAITVAEKNQRNF